MAEYITGRLLLETAHKADKCTNNNTSSRMKKISDLMFIKTEDGFFQVREVSAFTPARADAIVKGIEDEHGVMRLAKGPKATIKWPKGNWRDDCKAITDLKQKGKAASANEMTLREFTALYRRTKLDTLVFETPADFRCKLFKADSKMFGLPQTRNRGYLLIWIARDDDDDLGRYWRATMKHLQSPVRLSVDALLLPDDHPSQRVLREGLNGPSGQESLRRGIHQLDMYREGSTDKNNAHFEILRTEAGIRGGVDHRPITNYVAASEKNPTLQAKVSPLLQPELLVVLRGQHSFDNVEIFAAQNARDAEAHDVLHSLSYMDISQNPTKIPHRSTTPGTIFSWYWYCHRGALPARYRESTAARVVRVH